MTLRYGTSKLRRPTISRFFTAGKLMARRFGLLIPIALSAMVVEGQTTSQTAQTDSARVDSARGTITRPLQTLSTLTVSGSSSRQLGVSQTASQGTISSTALMRRPMAREGEIMEAIPGMILTQHSGDGKANQMFVRGFNLDHGTDFQTRIESMPLNMPTHAHGQGYTDLNVLIPELVAQVDYKLGPYYAEFGDFGSAGGATLQLARALEAPILRADVGAFGYARTVLAGSHTQGSSTFLLGGEAKAYDGPWERAQGLRKLSGLARWTYRQGRNEISVLGMTYQNRWNASDQIPLRATTSGTISRFGQIDDALGGASDRHSLSLSWRRTMQKSVLRMDLYGIRYGFTLWSNFTYRLDNATGGDQFEQSDNRTVGGFDVEYIKPGILLGRAHTWRVGTQGRYDDARVELNRSAARQRTDAVRADDVRVGMTSLWSSVESRWLPHLRTTVGLRGDAVQFGVQGDRAENAGKRSAAILSPKASFAVGPFRGAEFYAGGGMGFHSNDARGSTIRVVPQTNDAASPVTPLVRSVGGEVGARVASSRSLMSSVSLWTLALDSELLFVGDAGNTDALGRSVRSGITLNSEWQPVRSLFLDTDVSWARARLVDAPRSAQFVPGAVERVMAAGIAWAPATSRLFGSVRVRHFGGQALTDDNSVRGTPSTLVHANVGRSVGSARVTLTLLNVLDVKARDVQYYYASRLAGEPADGVRDIHFHPAEPRQLRLGVSWKP